jgi:transcription-repair coupling factor (superfamily II helicase)
MHSEFNLIIVDSNNSAELLYYKLVYLLSINSFTDSNLNQKEIDILPESEVLPNEPITASATNTCKRINVLDKIKNNEIKYLITPAISLLTNVSAKKYDYIDIKIDDELDFEQFIQKISKTLGYRRVDLVENRGEFAVRGSIIDIFVPNKKHPYRIDFFGDTVETIKEFLIFDQRTFSVKNHIAILPINENIHKKDTTIISLLPKNLITFFVDKDKIKNHIDELYKLNEKIAKEQLQKNKLRKFETLTFENEINISSFNKFSNSHNQTLVEKALFLDLPSANLKKIRQKYNVFYKQELKRVTKNKKSY